MSILPRIAAQCLVQFFEIWHLRVRSFENRTESEEKRQTQAKREYGHLDGDSGLGSERNSLGDSVPTGYCCMAHFLIVLGSRSAGGRLPPERNDPGQASIRIDARSAS